MAVVLFFRQFSHLKNAHTRILIKILYDLLEFLSKFEYHGYFPHSILIFTARFIFWAFNWASQLFFWNALNDKSKMIKQNCICQIFHCKDLFRLNHKIQLKALKLFLWKYIRLAIAFLSLAGSFFFGIILSIKLV